MEARIYQDELAKLLGVEVRTLRQWRQSDFVGERLHLPAQRDKKTSRSYYLPEDVIEFCKRNPRYGARLLAVTAPEAVQATYLPNALANPTQPTGIVGAGMLALHNA